MRAKPAHAVELTPRCSWDLLCQVYQEQADRGVPEAVRGLEYIEQGRWPTTGRPRHPSAR